MAKKRRDTNETMHKAGLSSSIQTARNIMRKDAGLSGDLDRIPQLSWLLFLKAFDDMERQREVTERSFKPAIEAPYRWRDWAGDPIKGKTGQDLLELVNNDLLPYLRDLRGVGERDPRDVLAAVFKETYNRMLSGYLLRDVVDVVNRINFTSSDDIHTMAYLYESMLRDLRDSAGDSGEFYTPRPVIRFIVQQVRPTPNDVILDPAAGTCGFLVEALEQLRDQTRTVESWRKLQRNLRGTEKKPMPYLLGTMNMILHGVEQPNVRRDNALGVPLTQIGASAKVDVVVTNPPFGGEEEKGIQSNFPESTRASETALLFLQFIQRSLKPGGRCGMVVPNGFMFGTGVASRVKAKLMEECNLHTVVRLPKGVFAPYTDIPTNLIFFDKTGPTKKVWFYEHQLPQGRKSYVKTKPLRFDEFADCQTWWERRVQNDRAWRVSIDTIAKSDYNLDLVHPERSDGYVHVPPEQLIDQILAQEEDLANVLRSVRDELGSLA